MAFSCGFFNSKGLDRTYTAENFTEYLSSIICNGILDTYGQCFKLTAADTGLKVRLGTGKAWIDGHYFVNDSRYTIDLTEYQDESLPRYVAIAILLDVGESVRNVSLEITPGTPAENPSLPSLPTDEYKTRLLMYAVRLNPGATDLTERDWYDYQHFCCEENGYAIYYNQPDFNWGQTIYTLCVEPVHISSNRKIMLSYKSGATDIGEMWLVPKNNAGLSSAETARYIYESIQNHSAIALPFGWLGTVGNYVNVLLECSSISAGDYYLAWKAITDNTSPMIRAVKVVDVTI